MILIKGCKLCPVGQMWPAIGFPEVHLLSTKWLKNKIKRRRRFCEEKVIWSSNVHVHIQSCTGTQPCSLIYELSMLASPLQQPCWVVVTEIIWPQSLVYLLSGPLEEAGPPLTSTWRFEIPMSSGARHVIKMGEMPGVLDHGLWWIPMVNWRALFPWKGIGIQHCIKTLCQPSSVCGGTLDNLQPFKITHLLNLEENWHTIYYGIHFSLLVNARHIIRYHLENDTCFTPKKVWNGEIIGREGMAFKADGDQRRWAEGGGSGALETLACPASYSQGESKAGPCPQLSAKAPKKEWLPYFILNKSYGKAAINWRIFKLDSSINGRVTILLGAGGRTDKH